MTKIGFIGLGIMGNPMAMHLQNAGHHLCTVKHISPIPEQILEKGAVVYETPQDIKRYVDKILSVAVQTKTMPLGNMTMMTDEERAKLGAWIQAGASIEN